MGMDPVMVSHDQLITWMGDNVDRQTAAAFAERYIRDTHSEVEPGTEGFYALVLDMVFQGK